MFKQAKKYQRVLLIALIAVCMGVVLTGGMQYFKKLKNNLLDSAMQDVMNVTLQQKQSFDNFISMERERLHDCAGYFSQKGHDSSDDMQDLLGVFAGTDANFAVICLEDSWICSSKYGKVMHSEPEEMDEYNSLSGSGIRDNYVGLTSGIPKFAFYETFTFRNGHPGLVQKSYDRSKVLETFSLSLYNGQGYGYILNPNGDILILSGLGAVCDTDGNGQEAVEKFQASQPGDYNLILMDVQMPVMDGYSATRVLRAGEHPEAKTVPIIAMTANAFVDDVRDAIEAGMDAHIAKPVQINNLKSTILQVLDSRNRQGKE